MSVGRNAVTSMDDGTDLRLVVVFQGTRGFEFHCPDCGARLVLRRVAYEEITSCPKRGCRSRFRVATKRQLRQAKRQTRRERKREWEAQREILRGVRRRKRSGENPPDRLSIFGVTASGKSVFLSSLYQTLWRGVEDLSARALHGDDHEHLLKDFETLSNGEWLPTTLGVRPFDVALDWQGLKIALSSLDYSGEIFSDVFYRKLIDKGTHRRLYDHVQSTMGAILLVDPEQVCLREICLDVEFTGIEVIQHLRLQKMESHFVIVLTKRDKTGALVERCGGPEEFVANYLPRLAGEAPGVPVLHISAIRSRRNEIGELVPTAEGLDEAEVLEPLYTLLDLIDPVYLEWLAEIDRDALAAARFAGAEVFSEREPYESDPGS